MAAALLIIAIAAVSLFMLRLNRFEQIQRDARDEK